MTWRLTTWIRRNASSGQIITTTTTRLSDMPYKTVTKQYMASKNKANRGELDAADRYIYYLITSNVQMREPKERFQ